MTLQDRRKLADRLGFCRPVRHARDAMWQADIAVEACAIALAAAVNLDRLAEDLMVFASAEFAFIKLADRHARASKIMPQKRNPFALAFVRATANRLIGVQAGIAAASRTPSAQMDNRLFVYEAVPDAVRSAGEAASLVAECVEGLHIDEARARDALGDRSVCASDLAERVMAASLASIIARPVALSARVDYGTGGVRTNSSSSNRNGRRQSFARGWCIPRRRYRRARRGGARSWHLHLGTNGRGRRRARRIDRHGVRAR